MYILVYLAVKEVNPCNLRNMVTQHEAVVVFNLVNDNEELQLATFSCVMSKLMQYCSKQVRNMFLGNPVFSALGYE